MAAAASAAGSLFAGVRPILVDVLTALPGGGGVGDELCRSPAGRASANVVQEKAADDDDAGPQRRGGPPAGRLPARH